MLCQTCQPFTVHVSKTFTDGWWGSYNSAPQRKLVHFTSVLIIPITWYSNHDSALFPLLPKRKPLLFVLWHLFALKLSKISMYICVLHFFLVLNFTIINLRNSDTVSRELLLVLLFV